MQPETVSALQDLVSAGKSVAQAAKHLGIGRSTAYKAIRENAKPSVFAQSSSLE
jgi:DNA-binding phage protein